MKTHIEYPGGLFIPEMLTPLYHTNSYDKLLPHERLKYNQLHGVYFHEQIIFFEEAIIVPVISAIRARSVDERLRVDLRRFEEEERRHSSMFHELICDVMPDEYRSTRRHFIHLSPAQESVLRFCTQRPHIFVCLPWLIQMLEERAMYCSRVFLANSDWMDGRFLQVQRKHLADEVDHIRWDEELIGSFWGKTPYWLRLLNIQFLSWMMREFIVAPKRAAVRVIDRLDRDMGKLSVPAGLLKSDLLSLRVRDDFLQTVFAATIVPKTKRLAGEFDEWKVFSNYWFKDANVAA